MTIKVVEGYDLVLDSAGVKCKANFDGRDYPIINANGKASGFEACRISKIGDRGVSMAVVINGKVASTSRYTAFSDGRTLTSTSAPDGQPPTVVSGRR